MNVELSLSAWTEIEADALVVLAHEGDLPRQLHPWVEELERSGEFKGKPQELAVIPQPAGFRAKRLVLAGAGKPERFNGAEARKWAGAAFRALKAKGLKSIAIATDAGHVTAVTEGVVIGDWEPDAHKSRKDDAKTVDTVKVVVADGSPTLEVALNRGLAIAAGQNFARSLANEPGNLLPPLELATRAQLMAGAEGLECEIFDEAQLRSLGFGSLLGVAQGSSQPPALILIRYAPPDAPADVHLGLVGKGVTFDTGGISIKPSDGMEKMKYDMSGGAAMLGAMLAIARLQPALRVTALVPAVENMPGANAQRPGDIVRSLAGKTVEVLNTDAEGRLILIDAITYAKQIGCTHLVDAATLTGAIGVALGAVHAGAFTNSQPLLDRVMAAAKVQGEKMWPMPMDDEYKEMLKSPFADMPNISGGRLGGSITAAKFLEEWAEHTPWVHLDIANVAWIDDGKPWLAKGPSGYGVRTMVELACSWR